MHAEALAWIRRFATRDPVDVLDIGGRDLNGSPRSLFPAARRYIVLDIRPGPNVDIVADAALWVPDREYDVVLCAEVFEHTPDWVAICMTARRALKAGGLFIVTAAGPNRPPHSGIDVGPLQLGEWYANVYPGALRLALEVCGFVDIFVDQQASPSDVRAVAVKHPASRRILGLADGG